jgi:hypothetical protein
MKELYKARIEVPDAHVAMLNPNDFEDFVTKKLASEFVSIIRKKMSIATSPNYTQATRTFEAAVVVLSVDEYNNLVYNSDKKPIHGYAPAQQVKQEFDAVQYLKDLMNKTK